MILSIAGESNHILETYNLNLKAWFFFHRIDARISRRLGRLGSSARNEARCAPDSKLEAKWNKGEK